MPVIYDGTYSTYILDNSRMLYLYNHSPTTESLHYIHVLHNCLRMPSSDI